MRRKPRRLPASFARISSDLLTDFPETDSANQEDGQHQRPAAMIPGVGKAIKDVDIDNDAFKGIEAMIMSMTPYERSIRR